MKALVVDDSKAMRMILKKILGELGFEVSEAGNGLEGMDLLQKETGIELVLVDWNMPEMNGYDFVQAIRSKEQYDALRLVMVTSETQPEGIQRVEEAGADGYVTKPFTRDLLGSKLESLGFMGGRP